MENLRGGRDYTPEELTSCVFNQKPGTPDLVSMT
jgi:hypothetical protein